MRTTRYINGNAADTSVVENRCRNPAGKRENIGRAGRGGGGTLAPSPTSLADQFFPPFLRMSAAVKRYNINLSGLDIAAHNGVQLIAIANGASERASERASRIEVDARFSRSRYSLRPCAVGGHAAVNTFATQISIATQSVHARARRDAILYYTLHPTESVIDATSSSL